MKIKIISIDKVYDPKEKEYKGHKYTEYAKLCLIDNYGKCFVNSTKKEDNDSIQPGVEIEAEIKKFTNSQGIEQTAFRIKKEQKENNWKGNKYPEKKKCTIPEYMSYCNQLYIKAEELNKEKTVEVFQILLNNSGFYTDPTMSGNAEKVNNAFNTEKSETQNNNTPSDPWGDQNIPF